MSSLDRAADIRRTAAILVVDDDEFMSILTVLMLRNLGYVNVTTAAHGAEALSACTATAFDLILMDCEMPVMDGAQAAHAIRAIGVRAPIVAYTANVSAANLSKCAAAGMSDFLAKPARSEQVGEMLCRWLSARIA